MSNIASTVSSFAPSEICAEQNHASLLQESEHSNLSKLLYEKQYLTLQELEALRKAIESQQQIQMTIKNNNPLKVHIQCRHFKSKKCSFQITYKAVVGDEATAAPTSSSATEGKSPSTTQVSEFSGISASLITPTILSTSATSSSFSKISIDSSVAVAQYSSKNEGAASLTDIKRTSAGRREDTFIPATASVDPQHLNNNINTSHKSKDNLSAGASAAAFSAAASTILSTAAANLDVACSPTHIGLVENCTTPSPPQQSLRNHTQSVGTTLCMSSWQQSIPPATKLLQNSDASATMWEGEKREARHNSEISEQSINTNNSINATQSSVQQNKIILEEDHSDFSSDDEGESGINMIDEDQCEHLRSPTISPFVFNDASSGAIEIPYLCLNDPRDFSEQTKPTTPATSEAQSLANTAPLLFKLSTYKLSHRNHPVMSDEQYTIHLAKRWLEGHQEKIERIYVELREKKGQSFKITPKIIKKQLQDSFDIDIYAKCTDKEHKRFLKKKLDNLMKAIRQKERAASKKNPVTKQESAQSEKPAAAQKPKRRQPVKSVPASKNASTTAIPSASLDLPTIAPTTVIEVETQVASSAPTVQPQSTEDHAEPVQPSSIEIEVEDSPSTAPEKEPKTDCEYSSLIQEEEEFNEQFFLSKTKRPSMIPEPKATPSAKIIKEEWESFLEFDLLPQQRMQSAC